MAVQADTVVTLAEMRQFLNITDADDTTMDNVLTSLLDELNDAIADYLGLDNMLNTTYTNETHDGDGTAYLFPDHVPIISVTSITEDDISIGTEDTDYYVYERYIKRDDEAFDKDEKNIKITYMAGHGAARTDIPRTIKLALKKWVANIYRGDVLDTSSQYGEEAVVQLARETMPKAVENLLAPYVKVRFGVVPK